MDSNTYTVQINNRTYHITQRTDWQQAHRRTTPDTEPTYSHDYANYRIDGVRGARGGFQLHRYPNGTYRTTEFRGISHIEGYDNNTYLKILTTAGII